MNKYTINLLLATVFTAGPLFAMESDEGDKRSFVSPTAPSAMETLDFAPTSQILDSLDARSCLSLQVTSKSMQQKIEEYKERVVSVLDNPDQYPDKVIIHAIGFLSPKERAPYKHLITNILQDITKPFATQIHWVTLLSPEERVPYHGILTGVFGDARETPEDRQLAAALLPDAMVRTRLAIHVADSGFPPAPYGTGTYDNISLVNILKRFPADDEVRLKYIWRNSLNLEYIKLFPSGYDRSSMLINYIYRLGDSLHQHSNPLDLQIQAAQILAQEPVGDGLCGNIKSNLWHIQNDLFAHNLSSAQIIQVAELLLPGNYPNPLSFARGEKLLKLAKDGTLDSNIRRKAANLLADSEIKTQLLQDLSSAPSPMEEVD